MRPVHFLTLCAMLHCASPASPQEGEGPDHRRSQVTPLAVTSSETGEVVLLDRASLRPLRTLGPERPGAPPAPMLVVEDTKRRVFYVGNFRGGLGRVPMDGGNPTVLDLGGAIIGMALSPDGSLLAVNGARNLKLRLVDLLAWRVKSVTALGNPDDPPLHLPLTHGLASTHPFWLQDGSGVLTQDNIHEEIVLVRRDGAIGARRRARSAVHAFLPTGGGEVLALAEGTVDGTVKPAVLVLEPPSLHVLREVEIPLAPGEPAKLHHGALSPDGETVVVANMGPMHGERFGTTVAAVRWRTGALLWQQQTVRNAGHVRFLPEGRVLVLGHRAPTLALLDATTGEPKGAWPVTGAALLGHALAAEGNGTVLLVDTSGGRLLRVGPEGVIQESPRLGGGFDEASLPE